MSVKYERDAKNIEDIYSSWMSSGGNDNLTARISSYLSGRFPETVNKAGANDTGVKQMITDKDREELIEDLRAYNDAWVLEEGKDRDRLIEFESAIRAESAEQARKEADEKLAIAVKALEEIKTLGTHSTLSGRTTTGERIDSTTIINTYGIKARDALKEIQG